MSMIEFCFVASIIISAPHFSKGEALWLSRGLTIVGFVLLLAQLVTA